MCCEIFDTNINTLKGWIFKIQMIMKWLPLVEYLVVSDIIAIIPFNKRQKFNRIDHLTDDQITKTISKAVLADVTWRGDL